MLPAYLLGEEDGSFSHREELEAFFFFLKELPITKNKTKKYFSGKIDSLDLSDLTIKRTYYCVSLPDGSP